MFKLIRQRYSTECGAACLAMVCNYYGVAYPLSQLGALCPSSADGVSMLSLQGVAKELGFDCFCTLADFGVLDNLAEPCILHWNQNHYVVFYGRKGNQYLIADPAKGKLRLSAGRLKNYWLGDNDKGAIMLLQPTTEFGCLIKPEPLGTLSARKFLGPYIKRYWKSFIPVTACLLIGCLLELLMPFLTQAIVDKGIKNNNLNIIQLILVGELFIVVGSACADFIRRRVLLRTSLKININLITDFFAKLFRLPMGYFESKHRGDFLQRIADHGRVQSFLTSQLLNAAFAILTLCVFAVVLYIYNYLIFLIFLIGTLLYVVWIKVFMNKRRILDYELFEKEALSNNCTYQLVDTMQEIKLQDSEKHRQQEWSGLRMKLFETEMQVLNMQQNQDAGAIAISEIKNIVITIFTATAVINGSMTFGQMLAVQYIIGQLNSPVERLIQFVVSLQEVRIALERISEVHTARPENENPTHTSVTHGDITLENVDFQYERFAPSKTINNVSIVAPYGKVTAIVGSSGSGKTTLAKLILGYYPPAKGRIRIGSQDLANTDIVQWRKVCGVVMQEGNIFAESIALNIACGDENIDFDRLKEAADIAGATEFIDRLPHKFNTKIGNGGNSLSVGQRQRILIARAVYRNPQYIIFDEATNSLDAATEKAITTNLESFFKGRTVIVIAHRLSTVKNADNIIVIDHGEVVEQGTHAELCSLHGTYYNLVKNQLDVGD